MPYDRTDYAKRDSAQLKRIYLETLERSTRADTMEAALTDEFILQEITAVLLDRGEAHPFIASITWRNDSPHAA